MISYYLTIYPKPFPEQDVYKTLLEAIPPGKFYLLAPITIPYSPAPQPFILYTDAWDQVIKVWVNGKEQQRLIPIQALNNRQVLTSASDPRGFHIQAEVPLIFDMGTNTVHVEIDNGQAFDLLVVANPIASLYKAFSTTLFDNLVYPLQQQNDSLMSPWSPELMESLLRFHALLPDLRIPKTHAIKLAVRSLMAHSGTNLGVQAFASALAYNNPYIVPSTSKDFLKLTYDLVLRQDEISGSEFHMWLPSKSEIGWLAFSRLIYNLPRVFGVEKLSEAEDIFHDLLSQNRQEEHQYTFQNRLGPDFYEIIREIPRMKLSQNTTRRVSSCIGLYRYRYPLGLKVEYPMGNHVLGRRPRHLGPIEALINFSGTVTALTSHPLPVEVVKDEWGVNPSGASKIDSIALADDGDLSYIYHKGGGGAVESFRFDFSQIPVDAAHMTVSLSVSTRGVGPSSNLQIAMRSGGGAWTTLWQGVPTPAYSVITTTPYALSMSSREAAYLEFGLIDNSNINSTVRVTEVKMALTYVIPLKLEFMGTVLNVPVTTGMTAAQVTSAVSAMVELVKANMGLVVSYPSTTSLDITYAPIMDTFLNPVTKKMDSGKVIGLKNIQSPPGIATWFVPVRGRTLGTNDGVDIWAADRHDTVTAYYTDPASRLVTPKTFTPEIGFLGHSLTSTRLSGNSEQGETAQWGSMSGYYPSSVHLGVGSVVGATKRFTFPKYTFQAGDVGKNLVITRSTTSSSTNKVFVITSIISDHVCECANAAIINDSSISAKLIYRCGERRPLRVKGPQARLLSTSMLGCSGGGEGGGFITRWDMSLVPDSLTLELPIGPGGNYTVNWGDGSPIEANATRHTYAQVGIYDVDIRGVCPVWQYMTYPASQNLIAVVNWGEAPVFAGFSDLTGGFSSCTNLSAVDQRPIPKYGRGCLGFDETFAYCDSLQRIPKDLFSLHTEAMSFNSTFEHCISLISIPEGLFRNNTAALSFNNTFSECRAITDIPAGLFDTNTLVQEFGGTFTACTHLVTVPTGLFDNNPVVNTFARTFMSCRALPSIPGGLFDHNPLVTTFANTFIYCESLASIPSGLFDYCTLAESFAWTFYGCTSQTLIPVGLFDHNSEATSFLYTFGFNAITTIPSGLFDNCPKAEDFYGTFESCQHLTAIPPNLFDHNPLAAGFSYTFFNCNPVSSIPSALFHNNPLAAHFESTFAFTAITSIPPDLFDYSPLAYTFEGTFRDCWGLSTIPAGLFDNNPLVTTFNNTFGVCVNLTTIPSGLFDYNPLVSDFSAVFGGCERLTAIPAGLFDHNPLVERFSYPEEWFPPYHYVGAFYGCKALTSIPAGLFDHNPRVRDFTKVFSDCTGLTSVPAGLFPKGTPYWYGAPTSFTWYSSAFENCTKLQLNPNIFYANGEEPTRFEGLFVYFDSLFRRDSYSGVAGTAPDLWNCVANYANTIGCFGGAGNSLTSILNYADIPPAWK